MRKIRFAMIGYKFMGKAHSHALRDVGMFFPIPAEPELVVLCGRNEAATREAAQRLGWREYATSWEEVVGRKDIDAVIIGTPNDTHRDIALAALAAGKHVLCEKPLAGTVTEAREMVEAAERASVCHMVAFNYRRIPAVQLARRLIQEGAIGTPFHYSGTYLQDWAIDPAVSVGWRKDKDSTAGVLGDVASHSIDLARLLLNQDVMEVTGAVQRVIEDRTDSDSSSEDMASFIARFDGGVIGTFQVSRVATGRKGGNGFEIYGTEGALRFDMERLNELYYMSRWDSKETQGFRRILVGEREHPYMAHWWPPGHVIGWEHTFIHQAAAFIEGVVKGEPVDPDFRVGLRIQEIIDAVDRAATEKRWVPCGPTAGGR